MNTSNNGNIISKYVKIAVLGAGSYGTVYQVKQNKTSYVLKEINMDSLTSVEKQRAFNEVSFLATLKHRHIIGYKDSEIDHTSGKLSIIMDYADSGDLACAITKQMGIPFSDHKIISWFLQISEALRYMHAHNILHRDLKTQNIFLCGDTVKIGDFGISRLLNSPEDFAKTAIGTPYYLSPEILLRKPYNKKSDMWALGCVLFEVSTLERPFKAEGFFQLMNVILKGKRQPFPNWMKSCLIKQLVEDLLCLNPDQRPTTNEILANPSLRLHLSGFTQSTKDISSERKSKTRKANSGPGESLKRSASVLNSNNSKLPRCSPITSCLLSQENESKQPSFSTRVVPPAIITTEYRDKFAGNERKPRSASARATQNGAQKNIPDKFESDERKQSSFFTRIVSPANIVTDYQDKFEANEFKPRSSSIRSTPPGIDDTAIKVLDKYETNEWRPRSTSTRASPPGTVVTENKMPGRFEGNGQRLRSTSIRASPPGIVVTENEIPGRFEVNGQRLRSTSIRAIPPGIVTENKILGKFEAKGRRLRSTSIRNTPSGIAVIENKRPDKFMEKREEKNFTLLRTTIESKNRDEFSISKLGISSRSYMNITYTVEKKNNSQESSTPNKLCPPHDIDFGYSSEEADSADKDKCVFEYLGNNSEKVLIQQSVTHEDAKAVRSSILGNQSHCDHSQCNECMIEMMWKNRIRGCFSPSKSNSDYLKLKKKLLLIFGQELFQKVYESLLQEWEGNENSHAQTSIRSYAKLLNYEQVQHLPLMMQLIQLDLMKLTENEACNAINKGEIITYL